VLIDIKEVDMAWKFNIGDPVVVMINPWERERFINPAQPNGTHARIENYHPTHHAYRLRGDISGRWYKSHWLHAPSKTAEESESNPTLIKESNMSITLPVVKAVTLVGGVDFDKLSDGEVFNIIASIDAEIVALEAHTTKPKKLLKRIEDLKAENEKLVALVDGR
jgi:hypothetical protein